MFLENRGKKSFNLQKCRLLPLGGDERGVRREVKWQRHACQKHHPRSNGDQRKTSTCNTAPAVGAGEELRHEMTPAEKVLWNELRANKLGTHFRRQQIIAGFIVDFYCHKAALVVEVDGDIHHLQLDEDAKRETVLRELGLRIVRFKNDDVIKNLSSVVEKIRELIVT